MERINFATWLMGIYMGYALSAVLSETAEYPEKPLGIFEKFTEDEQIKHEEQMVAAFVAMYNATF